MKQNIFLCLGLILFAVNIQAQIRKIPAEVTEAFAARYPHAIRVSWKDNLKVFEAKFILNNDEITVGFNSNGNWQYSSKNIDFEDLPVEVKDGFSKSRYNSWTTGVVSEINKVGKPLQYRVFVRKSRLEKKYLYFEVDGKLNREAITF